MMKAILADGTVLNVDSISLEPQFLIQCGDQAEFIAHWNQLTDDALSKMEIWDGDTRVACYKDCYLTGVQAYFGKGAENGITGHYYMVGTPCEIVDPDYKEGYDILTGEVLA